MIIGLRLVHSKPHEWLINLNGRIVFTEILKLYFFVDNLILKRLSTVLKPLVILEVVVTES